MNFSCLPLVFVFGCTLICSGQEASFKNYNDQNGLPSSEVYEVFQDSKGFIWFSTDNGVVRFDGGEFRVFNKSNGLADPVVFSTIEDARGSLWFRTISGQTSVYKDGKMTPYKYNDLLKTAGAPASMSVDNQSQVWFSRSGHNDSYYKLTTEGVIEPIAAVPADVDRTTMFIHEVAPNNLVFGFSKKRIKVQRDNWFIYWNGKTYSLEIPKEGFTRAFCKRWGNALLLSLGHLLYRLDDSGINLIAKFNRPIINISADNENNLWLGFLSDGAVRFSDGSFRHPQQMPFLKNLSVTSVLQDAEGSFWFSTLEKGVYYVPNDKILNFNLPEDSKINLVLANERNVWVGYYNGSLLCIDPKTKKKKWSVDLHESVIAGVFLEGDSALIATTRMIVLMDNSGRILKSDRMNLKKFFKTNHRVWSVSPFNVFEYDLKGNLISSGPIGFRARNILVNDNDIYIPGITGLHKLDKTLHKPQEIAAFKNDKISGLFQLPGNRILVTTVGNGFKIILGDQVKVYSKNEGLIAESIYAAHVDSFLWLGSEKGLLKIDLPLLLNKGELKYDLLDKTSGLINDKVSFISRYDNETWCYANNSVSIFDDREIRFANANPVLRLNRLTVNSNPIDSSQLLNLSYGENNIGFEFGFQSYNCRNLFLRHRSSPGDPWNYTQDLNVNYPSLAPAHYFFEAEYSTDRTHWRKIAFPNIVIISPVWWETIYFKLTILFVTGLIFFIYFRAKYKSSLLKLEMAEKLKSEKKRIAQDLHDNIGSRLVALSHELYHVVKEYEIEASTAEKIYENVNSTVSELRDTIWVIQKEGVTTTEFGDKIRNLIRRLRQNNGVIQYDLNITTEDDQRSLKPTQAINLYRIVQEAIANAQKHSSADVLSISVYLDQLFHRLCIKVEDNGKGFDIRNAQLNDHYGLRNMQARADEIAASFEISSNTDRGTQVMVSFQFSE